MSSQVQPKTSASQPRVIRLYDAIEALDILDDLIEEHSATIELSGGDIEAVPEIAELLAFAEGQFEQAVERWGLKIRTLMAEEEAVKVERQRLQAIENRKSNAAKRLKEYLKRQLEARQIAKVTTPMVTVRVQNNSQPSVKAVSETAIEELYGQGSPYVRAKVEYSLDSKAVLAARDAGEEIPAVIVIDRGTHLRVS